MEKVPECSGLFLGMSWSIHVLAMCSLLEAGSCHFTSKLSCSIVFEICWRLNCSCQMAFCNISGWFRVYLGLV